MSIAPRLRDLQSRFPFARPLKFGLYNLATRLFGKPMQREFRLLRPPFACNLAVDIGGNWGQSVWALKKIARPRQIISFEPGSFLADHLRRSFAGHGDVRIEQCALGDKAGSFTLHVPVYRGFVYDGLGSLVRAEAESWLNADRLHNFDPALLKIVSEEVQVRTLDDFNLSPDVIKIDVQGAELAVVKGGLETFRRSQPITFIETPSAELIELLGSLGLKAYLSDGNALVEHDTSPAADVVLISDERRKALAIG